MTEQLYKTTFRFAGERNFDRIKPIDAFIEQLRSWLETTQRGPHLVNLYVNGTDNEVGSSITVVLNDRDTALMLKLALG